MTKEPIEMVLDIIHNTNDGHHLSPSDLKLTENAVNGFLNEKGLEYLEQLWRSVTAGEYDKHKQFIHGIENLTQDHEGYILWKGKIVEHYEQIGSDKAVKDLKELAKVCILLESKGVELSTKSVIWDVEKYLSPEEIQSCKQ